MATKRPPYEAKHQHGEFTLVWKKNPTDVGSTEVEVFRGEKKLVTRYYPAIKDAYLDGADTLFHTEVVSIAVQVECRENGMDPNAASLQARKVLGRLYIQHAMDALSDEQFETLRPALVEALTAAGVKGLA